MVVFPNPHDPMRFLLFLTPGLLPFCVFATSLSWDAYPASPGAQNGSAFLNLTDATGWDVSATVPWLNDGSATAVFPVGGEITTPLGEIFAAGLDFPGKQELFIGQIPGNDEFNAFLRVSGDVGPGVLTFAGKVNNGRYNPPLLLTGLRFEGGNAIEMTADIRYWANDGTVSDGIGAIRLSNATIITHDSASLPLTYRRASNGTIQPNGHFVFENEDGSIWRPLTRDQTYNAAMWFFASGTVDAQVNVTHTGTTSGLTTFDGYFYTAANAFQTNLDNVTITKTGPKTLTLAGEVAFKPGGRFHVEEGGVVFLTDPAISGPDALARGVTNRFRYAVDLGPDDPVSEKLPEFVWDNGDPAVRFYVDPGKRDLATLIEVSTAAGAGTVIYDSRNDPDPIPGYRTVSHETTTERLFSEQVVVGVECVVELLSFTQTP